MVKVKEKTKAKEKCKCMPGFGIVTLVLSVVGIYSIILGIKTQFDSGLVYNNWMAMLYYALGILVMALAKITKYKAYGNCDLHKMN